MPSFTMFRYIAWRLISSVGALFVVFTVLIMVIDLFENIRFAGKFADGSFLFALKLTVLRSLSLTQLLSPFLFLFGSLWCFLQLNKRSEIAVMRSAGLSVWRVLLPATFVSGLTGIILIILLDPLSAGMMAESERLKNDIRGKRTSLVQFFNDGIWLRQRDEGFSIIMNAKGIDSEKGILGTLTIWKISNDSLFIERMDAPQAFIKDNFIELHNAKISRVNENNVRTEEKYNLPTSLSLQDINEQVAQPDTISVWNLQKFIRLAQAAGLPTNSYYLRYHALLSTPLKLIGMMLIAAAFSMRPTRMGGVFTLLIVSLASGFLLYVITAVATALGESGTVPLMMAAWSPAIIATLIAATGLLHLEDG